MKKRHFNAKHDDDTWRELFRRWHAGETSKALRAEAGVSQDTWQANAKRLGMRIRDLATDDPARRRVPAFGERSGDYHHPKSLLNERDWLRLLTLRAQGVRGNLLAEVFGVKPATICSQAKARGMEPPHLVGRPEMAFNFDPADPVRTLEAVAGVMRRAMHDGRWDDAEKAGRLFNQMERFFRLRDEREDRLAGSPAFAGTTRRRS